MSITKIQNLINYLKQQKSALKQIKTALARHSEWNHTPELVAKCYEIKQIVIAINHHIVKSCLANNYFHYTGIDFINLGECDYATGIDTLSMIDNHMTQLRKRKPSIDDGQSFDKYLQQFSQLAHDAINIHHKYLLYDVGFKKEATTKSLENTINFIIKNDISDDLMALGDLSKEKAK